MRGKSQEEVVAELKQSGATSAETVAALRVHKEFKGSRPSTSLLFGKLTPETLGALIAMYEHKIFVQVLVASLIILESVT